MNEFLQSEIPIVAHGEGWLVADKPAGIETVADRGECLTVLLRQQLANPDLAPVHRLDRDTSGCVLFATDTASLEPLVATFNKSAVKWYLGLCLGCPREPEGTIALPLSNWGAGARRPVQVQLRGGLAAVTDYRVMVEGEPVRRGPAGVLAASLVAFRLHTGRTHQIRVHASERGMPILGDDQYGERAANKSIRQMSGLRRQALHAWRLSFAHPTNGQFIKAESWMSADIASACDALLDNWKKRLNRSAKKLD